MSKQGLNEEQFKILEPQMEKWVNRNHYGRKLAPWRPVVNTIFWVLRTGAPWKDAPRNKEFSHPSTAHAWLGRMQSAGFLDQFLEELLKLAEQLECINEYDKYNKCYYNSINYGRTFPKHNPWSFLQ